MPFPAEPRPLLPGDWFRISYLNQKVESTIAILSICRETNLKSLPSEANPKNVELWAKLVAGKLDGLDEKSKKKGNNKPDESPKKEEKMVVEPKTEEETKEVHCQQKKTDYEPIGLGPVKNQQPEKQQPPRSKTPQPLKRNAPCRVTNVFVRPAKTKVQQILNDEMEDLKANIESNVTKLVKASKDVQKEKWVICDQ